MTRRPKDSTWGLSARRLSTLLSAMSGVRPEEPVVDDGRRLRDRLARPLPLESGTADQAFDSVPEILGRACDELDGHGATPLQELLLDAGTPLAVFETIKQYTGELAREDPDPVYIVLHYAAIGSALRFHGKKISSRAPGELAERFEMLLKHGWITAELVDHFSQAQHRGATGEADDASSA